MQDGIILNQADVRKILAEYFHVTEAEVIASKYSFVIVKKERSNG